MSSSDIQLLQSTPVFGAVSDRALALIVQLSDKREAGAAECFIRQGAAARAGIRRGDVILLIDNVRVKNSSHFTELVQELAKDKPVPILVHRQGNPLFLALKVTE